MKTTLAVLAASALSLAASAGDDLSPAQKAAGWKLYSGPDAASLWHGYKQPAFPADGWTIKDNTLTISAGPHAKGGGGDIVTNDQFADFELTCQFQTTPKANSGIMWRVTDKHPATWQSGPEYQILDDKTYPEKLDPGQYCASLYELAPAPADKPLKPAGEWNDARIRLRNGVVQHWLNGAKVAEVTIADDQGKPTKDWLDRIAASKFKAYEGFGLAPKGAIALQDHGDSVAYRDVKIRDLSATRAGEIDLYNHKDLTGWVAIVPDAAKNNIKPESVWSVDNSILICKGNPVGYIRTDKKFTNYVLRVEWRFNPVTKKAGNSGVLLRMVGEDKVWPKSVEAQLQSGSAGDFWNIDNYQMTVDASRTNGRNTKHTHAAERPIGEWNEYEIIVDKGDIALYVNGELLNSASNVEQNAGYICLQSEGAEIQFRSVRLVELK